MQIRPATLQDVQFMLELAAASPGAAEWTRADYENIFYPRAPRRICFIAQSAADSLGFIVLRADTLEWELENIAVTSPHRRSGIASALLREALQLARASSAEAIFLEVRASNDAAKQLYSRHGFALAGRRTGYYSLPQEDALVFKFSFRSPN